MAPGCDPPDSDALTRLSLCGDFACGWAAAAEPEECLECFLSEDRWLELGSLPELLEGVMVKDGAEADGCVDVSVPTARNIYNNYYYSFIFL